MDKEAPPSLFVNDGSFMERFKQLQQEKAKETGENAGNTKPVAVVSGTSTPNSAIAKTSFSIKSNNARKLQPASGGKLAFSLKQKSKLVAPAVKLGADEDENENDAANDSGDTSLKRQKLADQDLSIKSSREVDVGNYCFIYIFLFVRV